MEFDMKVLFLFAGMAFVMVGLNIAIEENAAYSGLLNPLYYIFLWSFYIFVALAFLALLVNSWAFIRKSLGKPI